MVTETTSSPPHPPVVVAVNATHRCGETLEMAAAFATTVGAELDVVFVEDANLLRLADLPVTREIDRVSGATREIDSGRMRRALESEARQLKSELARIGRASAVRSRIRVVRGQILGEALSASASVHVTFVHARRHSLSGGATRPERPLAGHGSRSGRLGRRPVLTLFKGGPESLRALRVAASLARSIGCGLTVLVPGHGSAAEQFEREARENVEQVEVRFLRGAEGRALMLGRILAPGTGTLLVLAKQSPELDDDAIRAYLEGSGVSLVLVT